uniref:C-type lectin domain-containing protein n=1 Tax=Periophthalmus magnuspinnatus TaxID=409849 RepID=A0A3B3ZC89_9GOBI
MLISFQLCLCSNCSFVATVLGYLCITFIDKTVSVSSFMPNNYVVPFPNLQGESTEKYILVIETMTWHEAQTYCRTNHDDLASIKKGEEHPDVSARMKETGTTFAWVGLYRDPWTSWSDRTSTNFYNWETQPDKSLINDHCGCVTADTGKWQEIHCGTSKPFFCYGRASVLFTCSKLTAGVDLKEAR